MINSGPKREFIYLADILLRVNLPRRVRPRKNIRNDQGKILSRTQYVNILAIYLDSVCETATLICAGKSAERFRRENHLAAGSFFRFKLLSVESSREEFRLSMASITTNISA